MHISCTTSSTVCNSLYTHISGCAAVLIEPDFFKEKEGGKREEGVVRFVNMRNIDDSFGEKKSIRRKV
jgi:hypothetical protein